MTEPTESEMLLDVAVLGEQVDQFMKSDVGKYLLQQADREYYNGIDALKNCDANDPAQILAAQTLVWRGESMRGWLEDAVRAGLKAKMILEDRDE